MVFIHHSNTSRTDIKENESTKHFSLSKFVAMRECRSPTATRQDQRRTNADQPRNMTFELDAAHPQAMTLVLALRLLVHVADAAIDGLRQVGRASGANVNEHVHQARGLDEFLGRLAAETVDKEQNLGVGSSAELKPQRCGAVS